MGITNFQKINSILSFGTKESILQHQLMPHSKLELIRPLERMTINFFWDGDGEEKKDHK